MGSGKVMALFDLNVKIHLDIYYDQLAGSTLVSLNMASNPRRRYP